MPDDLISNSDFDTCLDAMTILVNHDYGDLNEADTRHQIIDVLIHQCLGWDRRYIRVEEKTDEGYTDYTFSIIRPVLILEAKRTGKYFNLPVKSNGKDGRKYLLKNLCKSNENLQTAIEQVRNYCNSKGVEYGAVFNGSELVVFVANRTDGCAVMDGNALVFRNLKDMKENFLELWNLLSFDAVNNNKLNEVLFKKKSPDLPRKISSFFNGYPGIKPRNSEQNELKVIADYVLEDVIKKNENRKEFLEQCYSKSGAIPQHGSLDKRIYKNRYENISGPNENQILINPVADKKGLSSSLREIISNGNVINSRPVLIIGDVGVGKTTFIENLIQVEAVDLLRNTVVIKVDLGIRANMSSTVKECLYKEIANELLKYEFEIDSDFFVRNVYKNELARHKKGIYKQIFIDGGEKATEKELEFLEKIMIDRGEHVKHSIKYIASLKKKSVIIFIDNCDQRSDEDQQTAFLIACEIANDIEIPVFVTIRPETYHRSMKYGALSGYHPRAYTVSPPRIDDVINKRLNFSLKIANGEIPFGDGTSHIKLEKIQILIQVILQSLKENSQLMDMIENLSGGNVRQAINLINNFFGSPHVNTQKILDLHRNEQRYTVPFHEFFKSVIYGDHLYYYPKDSVIANLLSVNSYDEKEYFLNVLLLNFLNERHRSTPYGYIEFTEIFTYLESNNFTTTQIEQAAKHAYSKKLIEITPKGDEIGNDLTPISARITTIGHYHVNKILYSFVYIDAIIPDTTILDSQTQNDIESLNFDVEDRVKKVKIFLDYLKRQWNKNSQIQNNNSFNFENFNNLLLADVKRVEESNERNLARKKSSF